MSMGVSTRSVKNSGQVIEEFLFIAESFLNNIGRDGCRVEH